MYCIITHWQLFLLPKEHKHVLDVQSKIGNNIFNIQDKTDRLQNIAKDTKLLSCDPSANFDFSLMQKQDNHDIVLKNIVRKNLFPRVKFLEKERDLLLNMKEGSICHSMIKWCDKLKENEEYKIRFWTTNMNNIKTFHTQHRNNVIKNIKKIAKRKYKIP